MAESAEIMNDNDHVGGGSDALRGTENSTTEKPEGVPDKFWNAEKGEVDTTSLLSSYSELEKKLGGTPQESTPQETPPTDQASFDLGKYEDEYSSNDGNLKEESYAELQSKFGLNKNEVDKYIQFRKDDADAFNNEIFQMAGGEESYRSLMTWAGSNLSAEEVQQTNTLLETGGKDEVRVGVMKLVNKYRESVGSEPARSFSGNTSNTDTGAKPFASLQEAVEARKDKRFNLDPAYRQRWEERVGSSPFIQSS